jgi:cysteine desulfurase/selenocysteine lyase
VPINDAGELEIEAYYDLLGPRTRLVGVVHTSNALGTRNPLEPMIHAAHDIGVPVLVDGAQAMAHEPVNVAALDCDFFAFSGHKMFAPTGIGVLYGKYERLDSMPPYQGGGEMIRSVTLEGSTYKDPPFRFEAGTPDIAGAVGLGAAAAFLESVGTDRIAAHDDQLLEYATRRMTEIPRVRLVGTAESKSSILSFVLDGIHPHDVGTIIDLEGVAVRAGHHCAQPVMERLGVPATVRASVACYNTREDVDALVAGVYRAIEVLG